MTVSTILLGIGYINGEENPNGNREARIVADLNQKLRRVSDESKDPLILINKAMGGRPVPEWNIYAGSADRLDADAFIKYFMGIRLVGNDHMQLFIARNGPTNFESYWNGGGDAQTQFRGNANWRRGK